MPLKSATTALLCCQIAERFISTAKETKPVLAFAGPLAKASRPQDSQGGFFVGIWLRPLGHGRRRI